MEYLLALGTAIVLFLCFLLAFRYGLRLSMNAQKGIAPKPIPSPIQAIKDHKEKVAKEAERDKEALAWQAIEENDGYTPEERALINKAVK